MTPSKTQANILAGQLLTVATQKVSNSFDTFSGWLATSFGAAFALFMANLGSISKFVTIDSIKHAALLFLTSAVLAVIAKLLASFIAAGTAAATEGAVLGQNFVERQVQIDVATIFAETEKALFWPGSWFARRAFAKVQSGDFAGPSRMYTKVAQAQALFVIIQAVLSLVAAAIIVRGLAV